MFSKELFQISIHDFLLLYALNTKRKDFHLLFSLGLECYVNFHTFEKYKWLLFTVVEVIAIRITNVTL